MHSSASRRSRIGRRKAAGAASVRGGGPGGRGDARLIATEPLLDGAVLQIVGDQIFFRGDANGDQQVDLSDAQFTLGYLFQSGDRPVCLDAADSNDDGDINISDAVSTLNYPQRCIKFGQLHSSRVRSDRGLARS